MTVTTTATGRVAVAPAAAELALGVAVVRSDAASAYDAAAAAAARVVSVLDGLGLADRRTSRLSLHPQYDYRDGGQQIVGYEAGTSLLVALPPDRVADALRGLVSDDVRIERLGFTAPDDAAVASRARAAAYAQARAAAEEYASLAGRRLGELTQLVEERSGPGPVMHHEMALSAAAMPVEPGTTDVAVTVTATWSLA